MLVRLAGLAGLAGLVRLVRLVRARLCDARGSGTALAFAIIGATVSLAVTLTLALGAYAVRTRAAVAADAAALAAANTASGRLPGDACARAVEVAQRHRVTLVACTAEREDTRVRVRASFGALNLEVSAHAGLPPPD